MGLKKGYLFVTIIVILALLPQISAAGYSSYGNFLQDNVGKAIDLAMQAAIPFFELALGQGYTTDFFLAKSLLLVLIFIIVFFVLRKNSLFDNDSRKGAAIIVALAVSLLSVRFIPENEFMNGILLPYTTLGIAIATFLPLLIYFLFVHNSVPGTFGRRAAWAVYGIIFLVLWLSRSTPEMNDSNWIYILGIILVVLSFIFDKSIHKYFNLMDYARTKKQIADAEYVKMMKEYEDAYDQYMRHPTDKRIKDRYETLRRALHKSAGE